MRAKITKRLVDSVTPGLRDRFTWDTETKGFGLKVTPAGNRVYIVQKRLDGRLRRYTIGKHGSPWTPDAARTEATGLLGMVASGNDPAQAKQDARRNVALARLCDRYFEEACDRKKASTVAVERGLAKRHIKPLLGHRLVRSITRSDVQRFLSDVAKGKTAVDERTRKRGRAIVRGGEGTANRTTALLSSILTFAVREEIRLDNPARGIESYQLQKRERFLSAAELAALGEALTVAKSSGENPWAIDAIRLLVLTGCRKNEILSLRWDWVDFERAQLRLPDSKTGFNFLPGTVDAIQCHAMTN